MNIGEKIKTLRKNNNKSQEELAFELSVSRQTINKWETNKVQPHAENIKALCSIFGVTADYFLASEILADETVTNESVTNETATSETVTNETVTNEINNQSVSTDVATPKSNVKRIVLITCAVVDGLLFLIGSIFTALLGVIAFNTLASTGYDAARSDTVGISEFIYALILSILLLIIGALLLVYIFKNRQNTTKNNTKEELK